MVRTTTSPALSPTRIARLTPRSRQHRQGRVARSNGVILVRHGRAEHRHQAVAHQPADGPLVAVDGVHHQPDDPVEQPLGVFGVAAPDQLC
jgi:hypothetical protein